MTGEQRLADIGRRMAERSNAAMQVIVMAALSRAVPVASPVPHEPRPVNTVRTVSAPCWSVGYDCGLPVIALRDDA